MALVAFLRGINVGGHRSFRPSLLARELADFDVVNIGAAGTFVVRQPGTRATFRAALSKKLPFVAEVMLCDGRDIQRLVSENPFASEVLRRDVVRFVSIRRKVGRTPGLLPVTIPPEGDWYVRVIGARGCFAFGVYRRHMKTIGYLGQLDKMFGSPVTTRGWSTIAKIAEILGSEK